MDSSVGSGPRVERTKLSAVKPLMAWERPPLPDSWYRWTIQSIRVFACFTTDLRARIVTWDLGASELFGYRKEDVIGEDARFIFTLEDIKNNAPEREIAQAVGNRAALDERWHVRKDGTIFWASGLLLVLLDDACRHVGFLKIVRESSPPET